MKIEIAMNLPITAKPKDSHYENLDIGKQYPVEMILMGNQIRLFL